MSSEPVVSTLDSPASGTGWMLDFIDGVEVVYMDGRVTDASYDRYLAAVARDIDERADSERIGVVYYVPQPSAFSSARRRRLAQVLKEREHKLARCTLAYAMATPSVVVRSSVRVLFWIAPPPYPNAIVATPREAFEFIARHRPGLSPDDLAAELARRVAAAEPAMAPR